MYLLIEVCQHPGFLRALYFVLLCMDVIFTVVPIGLIVMLLIDFSKAMIAGSDDSAKKSSKLAGKRIIYAVILFAIPWIVNVFLNLMSSAGFANNFTSCIANARSGDFKKFDELYNAEVDKIEAEMRNRMYKDMESLDELKKAQEVLEDASAKASSGTKEMKGSAAIENFSSGTGKTISNEPTNPLIPFNNLYNSKKNDAYNPSNYVAMKDKDNGYSLGAWPKDANVSNLSGTVKTYQNGILIYPTTGNGYSSYKHNGIDIVNSKIGIPIYAPADGTLVYSEWGHTSNNGANETAYSATIILDKTFSYSGEWSKSYGNYSTRTDTVSKIFLTHMSGIKYRTGSRSNISSIHVNQGDLIGFMGIANGCVHLHMTLYNKDESYGISTDSIRKIYMLESATTKKAGE